MSENKWNKTEKPRLVGSDRLGDVYDHPAFGLATVSQWTSGGSRRFFGSQLLHHSGMSLTIHKAVLVQDCNGATEWHLQREVIAEIEMSHSQWSRLISSVGNGNGVPVTLRCYQESDSLTTVPMIEIEETHAETYRNAMKQSIRERFEDLQKQVEALGKALEEPSLKKREVKEIHRNLAISLENMPGNLAFVDEMFQRSISKTMNDAKSDYESFVDSVATKVGHDTLRTMAPETLHLISDDRRGGNG